MAELFWKIPARCVAIFNFVAFCVFFVTIFILLAIIGYDIATMKGGTAKREDQKLKGLISAYGLYLIVFAIYIIPSVYLSVFLNEATIHVLGKQRALRNLKIWIITSLTLLAMILITLGLIYYFTKNFDLPSIFCVSIQILFIIVVCSYKIELTEKGIDIEFPVKPYAPPSIHVFI